ncbi:hypothetical protein KP509_1Z071800 [Ceratopteris richardii]|nr:hypothetical protein KP509_1Z071800 [Ceratopteris richardii]
MTDFLHRVQPSPEPHGGASVRREGITTLKEPLSLSEANTTRKSIPYFRRLLRKLIARRRAKISLSTEEDGGVPSQAFSEAGDMGYHHHHYVHHHHHHYHYGTSPEEPTRFPRRRRHSEGGFVGSHVSTSPLNEVMMPVETDERSWEDEESSDFATILAHRRARRFSDNSFLNYANMDVHGPEWPNHREGPGKVAGSQLHPRRLNSERFTSFSRKTSFDGSDSANTMENPAKMAESLRLPRSLTSERFTTTNRMPKASRDDIHNEDNSGPFMEYMDIRSRRRHSTESLRMEEWTNQQCSKMRAAIENGILGAQEDGVKDEVHRAGRDHNLDIDHDGPAIQWRRHSESFFGRGGEIFGRRVPTGGYGHSRHQIPSERTMQSPARPNTVFHRHSPNLPPAYRKVYSLSSR